MIYATRPRLIAPLFLEIKQIDFKSFPVDLIILGVVFGYLYEDRIILERLVKQLEIIINLLKEDPVCLKRMSFSVVHFLAAAIFAPFLSQNANKIDMELKKTLEKAMLSISGLLERSKDKKVERTSLMSLGLITSFKTVTAIFEQVIQPADRKDELKCLAAHIFFDNPSSDLVELLFDRMTELLKNLQMTSQKTRDI